MANDITLAGNVVFVPRPGFGQVLHAGYGTVSNYTMPTGPDGFTVTAEIKTPTNTEKIFQTILSFGSLFQFGITANDYAEMNLGNQALDVAMPGTISNNQWHYLAFTYSDTAGAAFAILGWPSRVWMRVPLTVRSKNEV